MIKDSRYDNCNYEIPCICGQRYPAKEYKRFHVCLDCEHVYDLNPPPMKLRPDNWQELIRKGKLKELDLLCEKLNRGR